MNGGKLQDALAAYQEAIARDPPLGRAYSGMASIYRNLGQMDQAETTFKEALKHVDRMSEREKYRTLGVYNVGIARNYPKAVEIYESLIAKYPADRASLNNLAFAYVQMRNFARAERVMQQVVQLYPNYILGRTNHATYALYAGNFDVAIAEATAALKQNPAYQFAFLPLALAQLSKGDTATGLDTYSRFGQLNAFGASLSKLGRADASMYRGHYADVPKQLAAASAEDERGGDKAAAAKKYVALADAHAALNRRDAATAAARHAAALGVDESVLFPAALTLIFGGRDAEARTIAEKLKGMLECAAIPHPLRRRSRRETQPRTRSTRSRARSRATTPGGRGFFRGRLYEEMGRREPSPSSSSR
jgi:tetratricopeptide (TPR) repeat protein